MTVGGQITVSPSEPVCPGNRVIFTCQQSGFSTQWRINMDQMPPQTVHSTQVGSVITFGDPLNFKIRVVSNRSGILTTELQVTAVRELNGVTVECAGLTGISFTSTISIASVGEFIILL